MSWRATSFQLATGLLCHHFATYVCVLVRVEAVTTPSPPIAFTSLKSAVQAALVSAGGPAPRNCDELCIRNGLTPPTQGVGSCTVVPFGATGSQWPGAPFGTHCDGPNRPSPFLASIMACAAAVPAATPMSLNGESGIACSDASYCVSSEVSTLALVGKLIV